MCGTCYETIRKDGNHTKNKNRENIPKLEILNAVVIHCSVLSID